MSSYRSSNEKHALYVKIIIGCIVALGVGYYMVEFISVKERPVLGRTFYIVAGCVLMAVSTIMLFLTARKMLAPKKKRKHKSSHIFLDKDYKTKL